MSETKEETGKAKTTTRRRRKKRAPAPATKPKRFFIINPAGAMHEVTREHAAERLAVPGWRNPTREQVLEYLEHTNKPGAEGAQLFDDPLFERYSVEPTAIDIDDVEGVEV